MESQKVACWWNLREKMKKKNEKQTFGSARYIMLLLKLSLVTFSSLHSRLSESAVLSLQGIFSEIDLEKDAENELQQSEWLQNSQKGRGTLCVCVCVCI